MRRASARRPLTLGCMVEALVNCSAVEEAAKLVRDTAAKGDSAILNTAACDQRSDESRFVLY